MKRCVSLLLCLSLLACSEAGFRGYWKAHSIDYTDIQAAEDQFALYAEQAVAAPEAEALTSLDVLFDRLQKDEVAYFLYTGWIDGAFYPVLSPCRNAALYTKAVERMAADGIISEEEVARRQQKSRWIQFNRKGAPATVPGFEPDGRRTLVLVLDPACPSCREAVEAVSADPRWEDVPRVTVFCGDAPDVFDPQLTPVYFVVSADGTVETPYTPVL